MIRSSEPEAQAGWGCRTGRSRNSSRHPRYPERPETDSRVLSSRVLFPVYCFKNVCHAALHLPQSVLELGRAAGEAADVEESEGARSSRSPRVVSSHLTSSHGSSAAALPSTPRSSAGAPAPERTDESDPTPPGSDSDSARPTSAPQREGSGSISLREESSLRLRKDGRRPLRKEDSLPLSEHSSRPVRTDSSLMLHQEHSAASAPRPAHHVPPPAETIRAEPREKVVQGRNLSDPDPVGINNDNSAIPELVMMAWRHGGMNITSRSSAQLCGAPRRSSAELRCGAPRRSATELRGALRGYAKIGMTFMPMVNPVNLNRGA
eukprot:gene9991-biopygen8481